MPELMHITTQFNDHSKAITLCGIRFTTDHAATNRVKSAGTWISCPLCEAANIVNQFKPGTDTPEPQRHRKRKTTNQWEQPTLF